MKIALVLGAGGVTGMAYHAAALAAIENDLRWDPRRAAIIVGTSAGSVVGTLLRRGMSALELATIAAQRGADAVLGDGWPDDELWVCALRQRDHRRIVFGRDVFPSAADAVAASCCVPAFVPPVEIEGSSYLDGGVRSPTNADVLRRRDDLDLAIIVSPMSGRDLRRTGVSNGMRRHAGAKLRFEREILRRAGIPSIVIEPDAEVVDALGTHFMSNDRAREIVAEAFFDTAEQLRAPHAAGLLAALDQGSHPAAA